jgi:hypothetical protein
MTHKEIFAVIVAGMVAALIEFYILRKFGVN